MALLWVPGNLPESEVFWERLWWFASKASHIITLESRIQLNQSVWKTSCLVTCGFFGAAFFRLVGILEAGLDGESTL